MELQGQNAARSILLFSMDFQKLRNLRTLFQYQANEGNFSTISEEKTILINSATP